MSKRSRSSYDSQATEYYGSQSYAPRSSAVTSAPGNGRNSRLYGSRKRRGRASVPKATRAYVRSTVLSLSEKKLWNYYAANVPISTALAGGTPFTATLMPLLTQGTGQGQRIGNMVRVTKAIIRGHVNVLPYNASTNPATAPIFVKLWVISMPGNAAAVPTGTDYNNFFQIGSSSTTWQQNILDTVLYVNDDRFKVHHSATFKLGYAYNTSIGVPTATVPNNDSAFSASFEFSYAKSAGLLRYDDSGNQPANKGLYLIAQAVSTDGSSGAVTPAEIHWSTDLEYSDL